MLLKQIFDYFKPSNLHDYPLITLQDDNGLMISTDKITYHDLQKLLNTNFEWIGTWLPFTIKLMCDFHELNIKGAHL